MFKHIMLATDGSTHANNAADAAIELANVCQAKLTIVTVLPSSLSLVEVESRPQAARFSDSVRGEIKYYSELLATSHTTPNLSPTVKVPAPGNVIAELGEQVLNEVEAIAERKGVADIQRLSVTGHPAEAIADCAKNVGADMIVMGTRGLSDIKGIVVGSISHKVLHLSNCPCLCVH